MHHRIIRSITALSCVFTFFEGPLVGKIYLLSLQDLSALIQPQTTHPGTGARGLYPTHIYNVRVSRHAVAAAAAVVQKYASAPILAGSGFIRASKGVNAKFLKPDGTTFYPGGTSW